MELIAEIEVGYPSLEVAQSQIRKLYKDHQAEYRSLIEADGLDWNEEKRNDPWKGVYQYKFCEYRERDGKLVSFNKAQAAEAKLWVYRESDWTIMESDQKQSGTTKDPNDPNFRYYQPVHPVTQKPCTMPSRGWKGTLKKDPKHPDRNSWESLLEDHRIAFGEDENKVPQQKRFLRDVGTNVAKTIFVDYADGEKETTNLFGEKGVFLAPKHTGFVSRFLRMTSRGTDLIVDIFGGSGSTAGAVIESNRFDDASRKYLLCETNDYIDQTIIPRIKKTVYSSKWRKGLPASSDGLSHCLKVLRTESYEDALNNLTFERTDGQQNLLDGFKPEAKDDYLMRYMLDVESKGSLLSVDDFLKPFDYTLKIAVDSAGAFETRKVDLIETFGYLIGLRVSTIDLQLDNGYVLVTGSLPSGERTMVVWRDCEVIGYEALTALFDELGLVPGQEDYDLIYVNGDHNVPDVLVSKVDGADVTEKMALRRIEPVFLDAMFNVDDV